MSFKVTNFLLLLPTTIITAVTRCTRMQRRVNRLHTGLNTESVKPPKN